MAALAAKSLSVNSPSQVAQGPDIRAAMQFREQRAAASLSPIAGQLFRAAACRSFRCSWNRAARSWSVAPPSMRAEDNPKTRPTAASPRPLPNPADAGRFFQTGCRSLPAADEERCQQDRIPWPCGNLISKRAGNGQRETPTGGDSGFLPKACNRRQTIDQTKPVRTAYAKALRKTDRGRSNSFNCRFRQKPPPPALYPARC